MGIINVLGIGRDAPDIKPGGRTGFWHIIGEIKIDACLLGARVCGGIVTGPIIDHTEFLVGNGVQIIGGIKGADILTNGGEGLDHLIEIRRIGRVGVFAKIGQHHGNHIARTLQNGDSAISELCGIFWFEQDVESGQIRIGNTFLHHVHIKGQANGAPHIGNAIDVTGVPALNGFQAYGIKIAPVGQF